MVPFNDFRRRLQAIERLADGLESNSTALQEAAAQDAGFPVRITSMEVDLAVDYL
ncbi:MAG: hypothetical protein JRJ12_17130, partial [Deltaproteobacteria bacterium]|nr:hypothetical protein [Deltaproteobacteria bacterium]